MTLFEATISTSTEAIQNLRSSIQGSVHTPGEEGFDESRMAWNLSVNQNPALIVNAETAGDIAAAVQYAGQQNLGVAVQSTGHGIASPANGCLLIRTSRMSEVRVDAKGRTATVEAGAKWDNVLEKAQAEGQDIFKYDRTSHAALDYGELSNEILKSIQNGQEK